MPLTPADVANVAFSKPPIGKRGYHEDEVDAFLDLLEAELARLIEENNDLRNQVEQLDQQQRAAPVDTGPDLSPVELPGPVMAPVPLSSTSTAHPILSSITCNRSQLNDGAQGRIPAPSSSVDVIRFGFPSPSERPAGPIPQADATPVGRQESIGTG